MIEGTGRTIICSIVFMDIIGFSKTPVAAQIAMKERLNEHVRRGVAYFSESERIVIDSGDGVAICFTGDPEDAVIVATAVNDALRRDGGDEAMELRIGINLGPVKTVVDINGQLNVIGDGVNVAERVMSFAGPNEVLISRSYYEIVARLNERYSTLFQYAGIRKDKHVREHQVYSLGAVVRGAEVRDAASEPEDIGVAEYVSMDTAPVPQIAYASSEDHDLPAGLICEVEQRLSVLIGPLAKVIVARAKDAAQSKREFFEIIAASIQNQADRASFLAQTHGREDADTADVDDGGGLASDPAHCEPAEVAEGKPTEEQLTAVVYHLTEYLGPIAVVLVRSAVKQTRSLDELCYTLAAHIDDEQARADFLKSTRA